LLICPVTFPTLSQVAERVSVIGVVVGVGVGVGGTGVLVAVAVAVGWVQVTAVAFSVVGVIEYLAGDAIDVILNTIEPKTPPVLTVTVFGGLMVALPLVPAIGFPPLSRT